MNTTISVASASGMSELEVRTLFPDLFNTGIRPYIMDKRWAVAPGFGLLQGQQYRHHVLRPDSLIEVAVLDLVEEQGNMEKFVAAFDAFEIDKYHMQKGERTFYAIGEKPGAAITPVKAVIYFLNKAEDLAGMDGKLSPADNYGYTKNFTLWVLGGLSEEKSVSVVWHKEKISWRLTMVAAPEKEFPLTSPNARYRIYNVSSDEHREHEEDIVRRLVSDLK
jgi:hypothetical protein